MADATHIWADDDCHCLVLFRDADGNTYTDGDPFDWNDAHTIRGLISVYDATGINHMRCPICHNHIHDTCLNWLRWPTATRTARASHGTEWGSYDGRTSEFRALPAAGDAPTAASLASAGVTE